MTLDKPPTVRLDPHVALAYGLTPSRILKSDGVYEQQYDVPFLGFVDDEKSKVRLMIFGHGPREHSAADVTGLNKHHREERAPRPKLRPADDKQMGLFDGD